MMKLMRSLQEREGLLASETSLLMDLEIHLSYRNFLSQELTSAMEEFCASLVLLNNGIKNIIVHFAYVVFNK